MGFFPLRVKDHLSLYARNASLNGLKQVTSRGCNAWDVWDGKLNISKPSSIANFITSIVTCEPCPYKMTIAC